MDPLRSCLTAADDFQSNLSATLAGGQDANLSGEDDDDFFDLHIVRHNDSEVGDLHCFLHCCDFLLQIWNL